MDKKEDNSPESLNSIIEENIFFKSVLNSESFAIWSIDRKCKVKFFNDLYQHPFMKSILSNPLQQGEDIIELLNDRYPIINDIANYQRALNGKKFNLEAEIKGNVLQGSYFWVEFSFQPILHEETIIGVLVMAQDITARKRYERQLLEENITKENILGIVAHELRTPINNIQGFSNLIEEWIREHPEQSEDLQKYLFYILKSCEQANELIADLLEINTLESESYELETEPINLYTILQEAIQKCHFTIQDKQLSINLQAPKEVFIEGNASKMARVFDNLLSNAIKFSYEANKVEVSVHDRINLWEAVIRDYGTGMSPKAQLKLLDKFSSIRQQGTKGEKSTGLGMAIVKQIIALHQGHIEVESEEGKGTSVHLFFRKKAH
ncbi:MAG: ATP-binding protein [Thermonemataceae bacterium]